MSLGPTLVVYEAQVISFSQVQNNSTLRGEVVLAAGYVNDLYHLLLALTAK